jgi:copper chaperone CopZ
MNKDCHVDEIHKSPSIEERREQAVALLAVEGMGCPNCVHRVRNGLLQVYGVVAADVDLDAGQARVTYNPGLVQPRHLERAVADAGAAARHDYRAYLVG